MTNLSTPSISFSPKFRAFLRTATFLTSTAFSLSAFAADDKPPHPPFPHEGEVCGALYGQCLKVASVEEWVDIIYPPETRKPDMPWNIEHGPTKNCVFNNAIPSTCYGIRVHGLNYSVGEGVHFIDWSCPTGQYRGPVSMQCRTACPAGEYLLSGSGIPGKCTPNPEGKEIDPDDAANPNKGDPGEDCTGNPIHTASGNKFQQEIDTPFGIPFIRYYNSDESNKKHQLGSGWRHNWQARITPVFTTYVEPGIPHNVDPDWKWRYKLIDNGGPKTHLRFYLLERADGSSFSFLPDGRIIGATDKNTFKLTISANGFTVFDGLNTERYDAKGNLVSLEQGGGQRYTLTYADKLLTQVKEDSTGRVLTFTYARQSVSGIEEDQLVKVEGGFDGGQKIEVANYEYGFKGRLAKVTYPDQSTRQYVYDDPNHGDKLSGLIDESGVRFASWFYHRDGKAGSSEHAGGVDRYTLYIRDYGDTLDALQGNPQGPGSLRVFYYQRVGRRLLYTGHAQPAGSGCGQAASKVTYDQAGNPQTRTDFNGNVTRFTYDPERDLEVTRIEAATGPSPRAISTQWHELFRLPVQISTPDETVNLAYDGQTNLLKKTVTAGGTSRSWSYGYDGFNRLIRVTNPAGQVGQFSYDAVGNLISTTDQTGLVTKYGPHNLNGQALSITRPDGTVETMSYDARGRLLSHTQGDAVTRYGYAPTGLLKQVNLPDGSQIDYEYDPAHRLIGIRNNQGHSIRYTLDNAGNRIQDEVQDNGGTLAAAMAQVETLRQSLTAPTRLQSKQQSE